MLIVQYRDMIVQQIHTSKYKIATYWVESGPGIQDDYFKLRSRSEILDLADSRGS